MCRVENWSGGKQSRPCNGVLSGFTTACALGAALPGGSSFASAFALTGSDVSSKNNHLHVSVVKIAGFTW